MSLAGNLKHWRQVRGLTQPELAERAGIEQSYLSKLENGRSSPSENVRQRLAEALNVEVETLLRDPSGNGRRMLLLAAGAVLLIAVGFAAGFVASRYELREVNREGARLETIWSLAPPGIRLDGMSSGMITGRFEQPEEVRTFAVRLLESGLLGDRLQAVELSEEYGEFVIMIGGERRDVPGNATVVAESR